MEQILRIAVTIAFLVSSLSFVWQALVCLFDPLNRKLGNFWSIGTEGLEPLHFGPRFISNTMWLFYASLIHQPGSLWADPALPILVGGSIMTFSAAMILVLMLIIPRPQRHVVAKAEIIGMLLIGAGILSLMLFPEVVSSRLSAESIPPMTTPLLAWGQIAQIIRTIKDKKAGRQSIITVISFVFDWALWTTYAVYCQKTGLFWTTLIMTVVTLVRALVLIAAPDKRKEIKEFFLR